MLLSFIFAIIIGAIAGWIASKTVAGQSFGFITNVAVGIVGGLLGHILFAGVGLGHGFISSIFQATIGAVILLLILAAARRL